MSRTGTVRMLALAVVAAALFWAGAGKASAQGVVICEPRPTVIYHAPPVVHYYSPPSVSYYAVPAVTYYPGPVTTTRRYGLFGRRMVTTTYYPGVYVYP